MWHYIKAPSEWVGKSLCVRLPDQTTINTCETLQPECNCLPFLKKVVPALIFGFCLRTIPTKLLFEQGWKGNVWLVADGHRYNTQVSVSRAHALSISERCPN